MHFAMVKALGFGKGTLGRDDEQHQIAAVQKRLGLLLVLLKHGPGAGGVHQRHAGRTRVRVCPFADAILTDYRLVANKLTVTDEFDHFRCRCDSNRQQFVAQQGIDK